MKLGAKIGGIIKWWICKLLGHDAEVLDYPRYRCRRCKVSWYIWEK